MGWFKKPVTKPEDLKGLKFRTVGLAIDIFTDMGVAVNALPGAEIVPALDRGLLDAAEFNNASSDRLLGFPDVAKVCMLQSFHQSGEQFEILFNKKKYDSLPADLRSILTNAVSAASAEMSWKAIDRYSKDYFEMQEKQGVKFYKTPDSILRAQLESWDKVTDEEVCREPHVQEGARIAARLRAPRCTLAERYLGQPIAWPTITSSPRRADRALCRWLRPAGRSHLSLQDALNARRREISMQKLLLLIDKVSTKVGHVFAWSIVALTLLICYEVFSRYVFNHPHAWVFDATYMLYGTLFMMAGAYTLATAGHVRGDVLYGFFSPRTQATIDLVLYVVFFIPGVIALAYAGWSFAEQAWTIKEHSSISADGPPIYPFKTIIPDRRGLAAAAGRGRDHPLHRLHPAGRMALAHRGRRGSRRRKTQGDGARQGRGYRCTR